MTAPGIRLVGRAAELDRVMDVLAAAAAGRPGVVVISGEPGIGKTRLVEEVVDRAMAVGFQVATGRCSHVLETRLPYAPVIEMIDQVIRRFPQLPTLVAPEIWRGVAPLVGRGQRVAGIDRGLATTRLFAGVVELLHEFGRSYSALVVVEDVHWADPATADMVAFVAGKLARTRMALVVTTRRDGRATDPRIAELLRLPSACSLVLDPLTDDAVTELLDQVSVPADSARARRVRAAAGGIPFFALHLALHGENGDLPRQLRDVLAATLVDLDADERDIIVLLTVLGDLPDIGLLVDASGLPMERFNRAVRSLRDRGALIAHGVSIGFSHALMLEVAAGDNLPGETRLAHARAADALLVRPDATERAAQLGRHLAACGRYAEAIGFLVAGARRAREICAFADAAALFRSALDIWPSVRDAAVAAGVGLAELLVEASLAARWSGAVDDAFELVAQAAVVPHLDDDQQAMVDHARGQVLWAAGDMGGALAAYRRAADVIAHDSPLRAAVMAALAHGLMATGQAQEALGVASDAARLASTVGAEREGLHATITGGAALAQLGDVDAAVDALRNCLPRAIRLDDIELVYRCYGNLSFAFGLACRYRELAETAEEAVRTCARYGPVVSLASTVLNNQVTALVHLGRWAEAARLTRAALLDPAAAGVAALLHGRLAEIAVAVGADADADLAAAEQLGSDDPYVVSELAVIKADRAFWRGDPVEAIAVVTAAMPSVAGLDDVTPALELCGAGLRAAADVAALHRFNAVVGVVSELDEMVQQVRRRVRQPLAAALVLLCDAESARARDADDPGVWAVAAATNAQLDRPFWHAYCLMRRGAAELHRHARESAALSLAEARDIADALGARPLAGEIATLVRIGNVRLAGPAPIDAQKAQVSADRSPAEEFRLTEREAEVLRLLASGATNRGIARTLFISERTASVHVSNILRKMGVGNRTQAARIAVRRGLDSDQ